MRHGRGGRGATAGGWGNGAGVAETNCGGV